MSSFHQLRARLETAVGDLAWVGAGATAALLAVVVVWLAPPLSHLYPSPAGDLFPVWQPAIHPEPLEQVRSIITLAAPFLLAVILLAFGTTRPSRRALDPQVIAKQVVGVAQLTVPVLGPTRHPGRTVHGSVARRVRVCTRCIKSNKIVKAA